MPLPSPALDRTALVTGASSGIGTEIARELARRLIIAEGASADDATLTGIARESGGSPFFWCSRKSLPRWRMVSQNKMARCAKSTA